MPTRTPIVAIVSDLGAREPAVSQFKTTVLAIEPSVQFVDVSHEIRSRDLLEAAFTLDRVFRDFPTRTIFAVMVEQVLGAPRRPLLVVSMEYYYLAPDNGVLSFVYEHDDVSTVYHVTAEHYVKQPPGPLSPHRDLYGMAAGWLAKGIESSNFGDPVTDHVRLSLPKPARTSPTELRGMVLSVDRHGTLITNLHENDVNAVRQEVGGDKPFRAVASDKSVPVIGGWGEGGPELVALYDASGYVAIVAPKGDASKLLPGKRGDAVSIVFGA